MPYYVDIYDVLLVLVIVCLVTGAKQIQVLVSRLDNEHRIIRQSF